MWKRKKNTYVEENTNRAFQLELSVSQIRLVATRSDPNRLIETCVQQLLLISIYKIKIHLQIYIGGFNISLWKLMLNNKTLTRFWWNMPPLRNKGG